MSETESGSSSKECGCVIEVLCFYSFLTVCFPM